MVFQNLEEMLGLPASNTGYTTRRILSTDPATLQTTRDSLRRGLLSLARVMSCTPAFLQLPPQQVEDLTATATGALRLLHRNNVSHPIFIESFSILIPDKLSRIPGLCEPPIHALSRLQRLAPFIDITRSRPHLLDQLAQQLEQELNQFSEFGVAARRLLSLHNSSVPCFLDEVGQATLVTCLGRICYM